MAVGKEVGAEGTHHLQGVMVWKSAKKFAGLKKLLPSAHIEKCRDLDMAFNYCRKELNMLCDIDNRTQGKRSDLEKAVDAIKEGNTIAQLWADHSVTMVRHSRGLKELKAALCPNLSYPKHEARWPLLDLTKSTIIVGPAGVGKTEFAKAHFPAGFLWVRHMDDLLNLTPAHTGIIFDDMEFAHLPRTSQIHITDMDNDSSIHCRYSCAHIPAGLRRIFTTNSLYKIFDLADDAIRRRVTVTEVTEGNTILQSQVRRLVPSKNRDFPEMVDWSAGEVTVVTTPPYAAPRR